MKKEKEKIETRGGRREGAGAPRKKIKKVQIFFGVLPHLKNDINFKNYIKQKINEYESQQRKIRNDLQIS